VALVHTATAYAIAVFVIAHVYLLTAGHSFREHVMPMINDFDKVALSPEEEAYLGRDEPSHIRRSAPWVRRFQSAPRQSGYAASPAAAVNAQ